MKVLLTGANGYIGRRLLPVLLEAGHQVVCAVRERSRIAIDHLLERYEGQITFWEVDFLDDPQAGIPTDIDVAYYLIHSLSTSVGDFADREERAARHFCTHLNQTQARQIIYLSGIVNEQHLSPHLSSRLAVEEILRQQAKASLTVLRAAIVIGSGSASFEIIRDLVEKLPVMVAPRWLSTRCQPIAVRNVIECLEGVMLREDCFDQVFDIGGPDRLTYRQMLLTYARVRGLKRWIWVVPVMTPRLSSYWLYFVTSTTYPLAVNLVESMKVEVLARPNDLGEKLGIEWIDYAESIELAFQKIEQQMVISSWKDAMVTTQRGADLQHFFRVPEHGVLRDVRERRVPADKREQVLDNLWAIGGKRGWYYGNILWRIRGWLDKMVGGIGLRRGRTNLDAIYPGDALDFWRVLAADRREGRLLLLAEMKLPGEAWLEFKLIPQKDGDYCLRQTATFRPHGLWGRLYWYLVLPLHEFVFPGMLRGVLNYEKPAAKAQSEEAMTRH
ncbi:MAG: SDR family oxidoreductase [Bacteroidetes bacterium]|nr:MAG: SDR family oxidoreductase [Bacteroidota bacterium]